MLRLCYRDFLREIRHLYRYAEAAIEEVTC